MFDLRTLNRESFKFFELEAPRCVRLRYLPHLLSVEFQKSRSGVGIRLPDRIRVAARSLPKSPDTESLQFYK